ncbi:MAG: MotA/TolQ/ExbB proton channel family protein [bacterium]
MELMDYLQQGGPIMWILLGCSITGFTLVFERAVFWVMEFRRVDRDELEDFFSSIHHNNLEDAMESVREAETKLLKNLVDTWDDRGSSALMEAFDLAINRIEKRAHRYLYGLKTIVSISPLLGILGTVIGIIQSFEVLGSAGAAANPQAVGSGLAQALLTTAFGLMIAVPCLIAHNYFKAKATSYVTRFDDYAGELAFHLNERTETNEAELKSEIDEPTEALRETEPVP